MENKYDLMRVENSDLRKKASFLSGNIKKG